jgi:hypothetical protein
VTDSNVVCALNAEWRLVVLSDNASWKNTSWAIEQLVAGEWRDQGAFKGKTTLLWFVRGRCGHIDESAASILDALPARVDLASRVPQPRRYKKKPIASQAVERKTAAPVVSEAARRFLSWRQREGV